MNDYLFAVIYIFLGISGGLFHYFKKRYVDLSTELSLKEYLLTNKRATIKAIFALISSEVTLSLTHTSVDFLSLSELIGALTVGYTTDSYFNSTKEE